MTRKKERLWACAEPAGVLYPFKILPVQQGCEMLVG